jgi:hypothetical protein
MDKAAGVLYASNSLQSLKDSESNKIRVVWNFPGKTEKSWFVITWKNKLKTEQ